MPPKKRVEESEESSSDESVDVRTVPVATRKKFDDEEDSDDVADNWDEEEDSEVEREKAAVAAAAKAKADAEAAKNRKPKAVRIEEKREEKRRQRAAEEDGEDSSDEDEADKRARMRKQEQDADLRHAQDLLSAADIHPRSRGAGTSKGIVVEDSAGKSIDLASIALFQPKRKTDFDALSEALCPLLRQSSVQPHYALWISGFVKNILQDLPSAEIKKVASQITAQSNEKMKEEKLAEKTGKKSKAAKNKTTLSAGRDMGRGMADTTAYDDGGLDDGDFM